MRAMPEPLDLGDHAILDAAPVTTLRAYVDGGGGRGLDGARRLGPASVVEEVLASGLRGRGGAGFPTGTKWQTIVQNASAALAPTVVVNGAEGEPGSFKDRALLRRNPYRVVEGALIAALAVGADRVVIAVKRSFTREVEGLERAVAEATAEGWADGVAVGVFAGPSEYLYGEETALLEVLDGRSPFPRVAPPSRHGVDEVGGDTTEPAGTELAGPGGTVAPPTLVNNVETVANLPGILANGADWYRAVGTAACPGTFLCTVSGAVRRAGVGELPFGTPVIDVIEAVGGGAGEGRRVVAVLPGVSGALLREAALGTPATHEDLQAAGSALGAGAFVVLDDATDPVALAAGVSRFLAVESCGQCMPCKGDGMAIAEILDRLARSEGAELDLLALDDHVQRITDGARCFLAHQHQAVLASVTSLFGPTLRRHAVGEVEGVEPVAVVPVVDLTDDGRLLGDMDHLDKNFDWSTGDTDSGAFPAERTDDRQDQETR
jgi:NADH:ubiquinone oxidoreductase subunit F (NADH-binding)